MFKKLRRTDESLWKLHNLSELTSAQFIDITKDAAQYCWWPKKYEMLPLLFTCARVLLCFPATSTACESLHSVAGHISSGQRSSLTASNVGLFSIGKLLLRRAIKKVPDLHNLNVQEPEGEFAALGDIDVIKETLSTSLVPEDVSPEGGDIE